MTAALRTSVDACDDFAPTPRARIAIRHRGDLLRPSDRQVEIEGIHTDVFAGVVRTVDAVADIGNGRERLETMQESRRNVQMAKIDIVEQKRLVPTEVRRPAPRVYDDVEHRAVRAPNELRFTGSRPAVQPTNDSLHGTRLGVLDELCRSAGAHMLVEDLCVECPGEKPAFVSERLGGHQQYALESRLLESHEAIVS